MGYRSFAHDPNTGTLGSLTPGVSGRGVERPLYQYPEEDTAEDDLDLFVDELLGDELEPKLRRKIDYGYTGGKTRAPRGTQQYYVGGNIIAEFDGAHRNVARKGISPYKQAKHSGPPLGTGSSNQAFRTTGNYRRTGTQYGSSRAHKPLTDIADENMWHISKMSDPMERAFLRHNNRVKKILNLIKECLVL